MIKNKACVYTFSNTLDNYGQVLQYLAIQKFLEKLGYKAYVLRKEDKDSIPVSLPFRIASSVKYRAKRFLKYSCNFVKGPYKQSQMEVTYHKNSEEQEMRMFFKEAQKKAEREEAVFPRNFEQFRQQFFNIEYYNDLRANPPQADVYVVGSDQVWSWFSAETLLDFGLEQTKRIAFAPSFGGKEPDSPEQWKIFSDGLRRFDLVTVREKEGVCFCEKADYPNAYCIPDPTLLLKAEEYDEYLDKSLVPPKDYIFIYLLGNYTDINLKDIFGFAQRKGLDIIYVVSQGRNDEYPKVAATVPQWLSYIKGAKYVFTNSFHGTAFSIIFRRLFMVFPLIGPFLCMNNRIFSLLDKYNMKTRIYTGNINIIDEDIEYMEIDKIRFSEIDYVNNLMSNVL